MSHTLAVSPAGHLFVEPDEQVERKLRQATASRLTEGFAASPARGLEMLASGLLHEPLPPPFVFWRGLAQRLFTALCHQPNLENASTISIPKPSEADKAEFTFTGFDEMDETSGKGWASPAQGRLVGHFKFHQGDKSGFIGERWKAATAL